MGWFDDNHWAGEAYNFGMGYMARAGFLPEEGLSDLDDSDLDLDSSDLEGFDLVGGGARCKGRTMTGARCKVTSHSPYPTAKTIRQSGYCSHHLAQRRSASGDAAPGYVAARRGAPALRPDPPIVVAAHSGNIQAVKQILPKRLTNDVVTSNSDMSPDLNVVGGAGDTALRAAALEGHHEVVIELLCAGADPKEEHRVHTVVQATEARLAELARSIQAGPTRMAAHKMLHTRSRLECVKAVIGIACNVWPLPKLPEIPIAPTIPDAASFTVEQLKAILRQHGAKLSGRKADLVQRLASTNFLELDHRQKLEEHERAKSAAMSARASIQQQWDERSHAIRQAGEQNSPREPTDAEIDAVAVKHKGKSVDGACNACGGWLGRQPGRPPKCHAGNCPGNPSFVPAPSGMLGNLLAAHDRSQALPEQIGSMSSSSSSFRMSGQRTRSRSPRDRNRKPICSHFLRGTCRFGHRCDFTHDPSARRVRSTAPRCCYFLQGKCRFGSACDFSHDDFGDGCHFGPSCWFKHSLQLGILSAGPGSSGPTASERMTALRARIQQRTSGH